MKHYEPVVWNGTDAYVQIPLDILTYPYRRTTVEVLGGTAGSAEIYGRVIRADNSLAAIADVDFSKAEDGDISLSSSPRQRVFTILNTSLSYVRVYLTGVSGGTVSVLVHQEAT